MHRPWEPHTGRAAPGPLTGQPLSGVEAARHSLPQPLGKAQTAYPWGNMFSPRKKPRTHESQTTPNAALGLLVTPCWIKLLLASALAFNFSPLNNHSDLPTVVLLTGVQRTIHKTAQG